MNHIPTLTLNKRVRNLLFYSLEVFLLCHSKEEDKKNDLVFSSEMKACRLTNLSEERVEGGNRFVKVC